MARTKAFRYRFFSVIAISVVLGSLLSTAPAHADPHAGSMTCAGQVPSWPGAGSTACSGTFFGADVGGAGTGCVIGCQLFMRIDNYVDLCILNDPVPYVGGYGGGLFIDGEDAGSFALQRVGAVGIFYFPDASGVVSFVPTTQPMPTCENPGPLNFFIAGPVGVV